MEGKIDSDGMHREYGKEIFNIVYANLICARWCLTYWQYKVHIYIYIWMAKAFRHVATWRRPRLTTLPPATPPTRALSWTRTSLLVTTRTELTSAVGVRYRRCRCIPAGIPKSSSQIKLNCQVTKIGETRKLYIYQQNRPTLSCYEERSFRWSLLQPTLKLLTVFNYP